ncbi:hypothetical protein [Streptomyces sp. NPDC006997]
MRLSPRRTPQSLHTLARATATLLTLAALAALYLVVLTRGGPR